MNRVGKYFLLTALVLALAAAWGASALAAQPRVVEGIIQDVYNDEAAGEALVSVKTSQGLFIIDCRHQSFPEPIAPGDLVKVTVRNIRAVNKKTVGDLVAVLQQTPLRR